MQYAPIIIFAFNRLEHLKETVASVLRNTEAAESDLYIFVDGARTNIEDEIKKVLAVQEYVKIISGFKSVHYTFSDHNKGLGPSIIAGVTEVINLYGKVIVLEDDLILSQNCLSFMNQGLDMYENEQKVFSVCGYTLKINRPTDYEFDSYFCQRSSSWGWATWKDRWSSVDWKLEDWNQVEKQKKFFNKWGGSNCFSMLKGWKEGNNKSWAIRFCYSQFIQDKYSLFPIVSKIKNEGFDGEGTNCKSWSRFKTNYEESERKSFIYSDSIEVDEYIRKQIMAYRSIYIRFWSKLMYIIKTI